MKNRIAWAILMIGVSTAAFGQGTTAPQTIQACFVESSGTVYIVGQPLTPKTCTKQNHHLLTWSSAGQAGPQGPAGPAGPQGPAGPSGGSVAPVIVEASRWVDPNTGQAVSASCPTGMKASGGGFRFISQVVESGPLRAGALPGDPGWDVPIGWRIGVSNLLGAPVFAVVWAICV
jgi:hypothetical protein